MSGTQFQKAKEDAAAIMREKQRKGMFRNLVVEIILTLLFRSRREKASRSSSREKEITPMRPSQYTSPSPCPIRNPDLIGNILPWYISGYTAVSEIILELDTAMLAE
jgi:hypothetical protein